MDSSTTPSVHIKEAGKDEIKKDVYSVWALPPEDVQPRLKKLMNDLRSEFGGPEFEPHVTVVGAISLSESEARDMFNKACELLKAYDATVEKVATGNFFYQCVFLLLHPTPEVLDASTHCTSHFGYKISTPYMPHLSLLYGDLTDEMKKKAEEKANVLDKNISNLHCTSLTPRTKVANRGRRWLNTNSSLTSYIQYLNLYPLALASQLPIYFALQSCFFFEFQGLKWR